MSFTEPREQQLEKALEKLSRRHPKKIDLSLERIKVLLVRLGNPEQNLPPVIHVAGTNGKGSVVAFLRSIFEAAGLKAHVYTSPHLVSFRERIRLAGKLIEEDALINILEACERASGQNPVTFFEITTAAALLAFSRVEADVCLLEVGLGGRLDATNVIEKPLSTIITPVGLDHAEFLGVDLKGVAAEKAAIAKPSVPLLLAHQKPTAYETIERFAEDTGAILQAEGRDWAVRKDSGGFVFTSFDKKLSLPDLPLAGAHQAQNAGTAIACVLTQKNFVIPDEAILAGLKSASWPARFQRLDANAYPVPGATIWLDGGHNPMAGRALARVLDTESDPDRPLYLVVGMLANKDAEGFLSPIAPFAKKLFAVPLRDSVSGLAPDALCGVAKKLGMESETAGNVAGALSKIKDVNPQILITGSLYLAGSVLKDIGWSQK